MLSIKNFYKVASKLLILLFIIASFSLIISCSDTPEDPNMLAQDSIKAALNNSNWDKALRLSSKALKMDSENKTIKIIHAIALSHTGKTSKAQKELNKIIQSNPDNFLASLALGKILYNNQKFEIAYDKLTKAHDLKPDNLNALILLSQCAAKIQSPKTDDYLFDILDDDSFDNDAEVYNQLGVYYFKQEQFENSIKYFLKAHQASSKKNPIVALNIGIFCDEYLNQPPKTEFFYKKFLSLSEGNPGLNSKRKKVEARLKEITDLK